MDYRDINSKVAVAAALLLFLMICRAEAQDFGSQWLQEIGRELREEAKSTTPRPLDTRLSAGEMYYYDTNVFLTNQNTKADSVFVSFAQFVMDYDQSDFQVQADAEANYNAYAHNSDANADEERTFIRAKYGGSEVSFEIIELFQRGIVPTNILTIERSRYLQSETKPIITVRATDVVTVEGDTRIDVWRFKNPSSDNTSTRSAISVASKVGESFNAVVKGGYFQIHYNDSAGPPDAQGYFAVGGIRGDFLPDIAFTALAGYTQAESDSDPSNVKHSMGTSDMELSFYWNPTQDITASLSYLRQIGFSPPPAPFQIVNFSNLDVGYSVREDLTLRGIGQYEWFHSALGLRRNYTFVSGVCEYRPMPHLTLRASVSYRASGQAEPGGTGDFTGEIVSLGAVLSF